MTETEFSMVSEWMSNGNINQFVAAHQDADRFELVRSRSKLLYFSPVTDDPKLGDVTRGLVYMHSQCMIHGDLKGVRLQKFQLLLSLEWRLSVSPTFWLIEPAMLALQISAFLQSSQRTQQPLTLPHRVAPPDG